MSDHEKSEVLLRLIEVYMGKWKQTRDIEFKVNIAIWTFLVLVVGFLAENSKYMQREFRCGEFVYVYVLSSVAIVALHYIWMTYIQNSEDRDGAFLGDCRQRLQTLGSPVPDYGKLTQNWMVLEVSFSAFILAVGGMYTILW